MRNHLRDWEHRPTNLCYDQTFLRGHMSLSILLRTLYFLRPVEVVHVKDDEQANDTSDSLPEVG